jgi:NitT/TauT family transport system permease protein
MKNFLYSFALPAVVPLLVLLLWYYMAPIIDNNMILTLPASVAAVLAAPTESLLSMGSLLTNLLMSFCRVMLGFIIGASIGIVVGLIMGRYRMADQLLSLFLELFRPIPSLAWIPLLLAWFGMASLASLFGVSTGASSYPYLDNMKMAMLFILILGGFFPTFTGTYQGVRSISSTLIDAARVLGATEREIFFKILLPGAAPGMFNGLRIAITLDWCHLVAAEMLPGSTSGMGYLIFDAQSMGRMDIVLAGMLCIGATGALLDLACRIIEKKKLSWNKKVR